MFLAQTDDLVILEQQQQLARDPSGAPTDRVESLWYKTWEYEDGGSYELYRVVRLFLLKSLPQEARKDPAFLDTMRTVLTGLTNQHGARFDLVQILAGMWRPQPVGVLQIYGVVGIDADLATAQRYARWGASALRGALAQFAQAVLEPLTQTQLDWLLNAYQRLQHTSVVVGHPDERQAAKGLGREGPGERPLNTAEPGVTGQQLEMFLRTMAALRQDFIAPLIATPQAPREAARQLAGIAAEASVVASVQQGVEAAGATLALPISLSANLGQGLVSAFGRMQGRASGRALQVTEGRAHTTGSAHTTTHTVTDGWAHTDTAGSSSGQTVTTAVARSQGTAHTDGASVSDGHSQSQGASQTQGVSHTQGSAETHGSAHTVGSAHTSGASTTTSSSWGHQGGSSTSTTTTASQSQSASVNLGQSQSLSQGATLGQSASQSVGQSAGQSLQNSVQAGIGVNGAVTLGEGVVPAGVSAGADVNASIGQTTGETAGQSTSQTVGQSAGQSVGASQGSSFGVGLSNTQTQGGSTTTTQNSGWSYGGGSATSQMNASTHSVTDTTSHATTTSQAETHSQAETLSQASGTSHAEGRSQANSVSQGVTISHAVSASYASMASSSDTVSHSESLSQAKTHSQANTTSHSVGTGLTTSQTLADTLSRSLSMTQGLGVGMGAIPSFNLSRSYQWQDDQAMVLTQMLRALEAQRNLATLEGAWQTDFYVLTASEEGAAAAEVALRQAFQGNGPLVVTPVQTRRVSPEEQAYLNVHALALVPSTRQEPRPATYELYRDSTLLLPTQLAAYMAPALFEEGLAVTIVERIPAFAFYPDLTGEVVWAHQFSTETGQLTDVPVRLARERFFHTAFVADTGYGKSVAAERLVVETTAHWQTQTVVLDFGQGWRKLLLAPQLRDHVEVWQLQPGGLAPFRWNPWQVGARLRPERQLTATCEIFKNAGRMGDRQLGYLRRAAQKLYTDAGVLVFSPQILQDAHWGFVQPDEWDVLDPIWQARRLTGRSRRQRLALHTLTSAERQALAVHRSRQVGLPQWIGNLRAMLEGTPDPNNATKTRGGLKPGSPDYTSLEGVLLRLEAFTAGGMTDIYGPGPDTVTVEDLGLLGPEGDRWGASILEGGAEMDEFAKSVLMGLVAWHLYSDAVVRRRERVNVGGAARLTQIVFEEANKVLGGVGNSDDQPGGPAMTAALFQTMWRDGRKYGIFLHPLAQSPAELPPGILSSCTNLVVGQLKNPRDRDVVQAALGWSEKGFTDEDYKRYISRMPLAQAILKLGYTMDTRQTAPLLTRPLLLNVPEPTDEMIWRAHRARRVQQGGQLCVS